MKNSLCQGRVRASRVLGTINRGAKSERIRTPGSGRVRVQGSGCGVQGVEFRVQDAGCRVQSSHIHPRRGPP